MNTRIKKKPIDMSHIIIIHLSIELCYTVHISGKFFFSVAQKPLVPDLCVEFN